MSLLSKLEYDILRGLMNKTSIGVMEPFVSCVEFELRVNSQQTHFTAPGNKINDKITITSMTFQ